MAAILIIEDDQQLALKLFGIFFGRGHQVAVARRNSRLASLESSHSDLVVYDVDSNYDGDGSYLTWLSPKATSRSPMLFLARSIDAFKSLPYYNPALDDCLIKPFAETDMVSRAERLLSHRQAPQDNGNAVLCAGPLSVDVKRAEARVNGQVIPLTNTEFDLLRYLLSSAGQVVSGERLLRNVWGYSVVSGGLELVRAHIKNLRAKIGFSNTDPFAIIQTIPRHGYIVRKDAAAN